MQVMHQERFGTKVHCDTGSMKSMGARSGRDAGTLLDEFSSVM